MSQYNYGNRGHRFTWPLLSGWDAGSPWSHTVVQLSTTATVDGSLPLPGPRLELAALPAAALDALQRDPLEAGSARPSLRVDHQDWAIWGHVDIKEGNPRFRNMGEGKGVKLKLDAVTFSAELEGGFIQEEIAAGYASNAGHSGQRLR